MGHHGFSATADHLLETGGDWDVAQDNDMFGPAQPQKRDAHNFLQPVSCMTGQAKLEGGAKMETYQDSEKGCGGVQRAVQTTDARSELKGQSRKRPGGHPQESRLQLPTGNLEP